jgi:tetratricopeptide (TPR) repeat protein
MTPDERRISAAQGYMELELYEEALRELDQLSPVASEEAAAIETRLVYHFHRRHWQEAEALARQLIANWPEAASGHIHLAYCLHELGRTQEAADALESGPADLRRRAVYYYNLGCYYTQMGQLDKALRLLKKSFAMDDTLRASATADPDLKPIADRLP